MIAPDQLNDVDRALQESPSRADGRDGPGQTGAADAAAQAGEQRQLDLDQTSLIGKIFIAFGALLTMASAARMFMA